MKKPGEKGYKARSVKRDVISFCGWDFLIKIMKACPTKFHQALIAALFETGGRVSEVIKLKKRHFDLKTHPKLIIVRNMPLLKRFEKIRRVKHGNSVKWVTKKVEAYRTFPIRKDEPLVPYLLRYISDKRENQLLFPYSRVRVYQIVRQVGKILNCPVPNARIHSSQLYPHFFRSQRACQLVDDYGFDIFELDRFFGWQKRELRTAEIYARMGWKGLARMMGVEV